MKATRENLGGNFCLHDRDRPRLILDLMPKLEKGGIPPVLVFAMEKIRIFFERPEFLPTLNHANNSRQMRSERREACVLTMSALLKYTDIVTLTVAVPASGKMHALKFRKIAQEAGISLKRCLRAVKDLKQAGMIKVDPRSEQKKEGGYKGLAAIKSISLKLFTALGLDKKLNKERAARSQNLSHGEIKQRQLNKSKRKLAAMTLNIQTKKQTYPNKRAKQRADNQAKRILNAAAVLKLENPDWTAQQCNDQAMKLVK